MFCIKQLVCQLLYVLHTMYYLRIHILKIKSTSRKLHMQPNDGEKIMQAQTNTQEESLILNKLETKMRKIVQNPLFKVALFSTTSMTILGSVVISPSLPALEQHFSDVSNIGFLSKLVLTLPAFFVMIFSPIAGILADRYGRLKFLFPSMLVWVIAGIIGFFLDDIYLILLSRAFFGIATGFVMTCASALIGDYFIGQDRQKAIGLQAFSTAVGSAILISLGGMLAALDWRYPFLVYALGIPITIYAYIKLFEPHRPKKIPIILKDNDIKQKFNFFKLIPAYLIAFFCLAIYYISPTQMPSFIQHNLQKDPSLIGISMSTSAIAYGVFSLFYPRLRRFFDIDRIYALCWFLMGSCFLLLYIFHNYVIVMISLAFLGAGGGIMIVNNTSYLLSIAPDSQRAKAVGFLSSSIFFGQFCSPFISDPIVNAVGIVNMFLVFAVAIYICALIFLFKKKAR